MGLMSKIANSKWIKGAGGVVGIGTGAFVPTYEMLNPPAIYAQEQSQTPEQVVKQLANLPEQPMARGNPEMNDYYKRQVAGIIIDAYNAKIIHGETRTVNPDGSVTFKTEGYLDPNQRCIGVQELYDAAKGVYKDKLKAESETNAGLGVLVQRAENCGAK
jgi:hypothetical protein